MTLSWRHTTTNRKISDSDYIRITSLAYKELLEQKCSQLWIRPSLFKFPLRDVVITSVQNYGRLTKTDYRLMFPGCCRDGYVYRNSRPGVDMIFYNNEMLDMRVRFTVSHELGHARLKHKIHTAITEAEAHLYASQILAPDVILWKIRSMGNRITPEAIAAFCGLSMSAATQKFEDYQICQKLHTQYDEQLIQLFDRYLTWCFHPKFANIDIVVD